MNSSRRLQLNELLGSATTVEDVATALALIEDEAEQEAESRKDDRRFIVKTLSDVASFFDLAEQTVRAWRVGEQGMPGVDGGWDLREIVRWKFAKLNKHSGPEEDDSERALRRKQIGIKAERDQLKLDQEKGLLIRKDEAVADITEVFATMKTRAEAWPAETASSFPPELRDSLLVDLKAKVRSFLKELEGIGL